MTWWPFRSKQPSLNKARDEKQISIFEFGEMWVRANREAQQRFHDFATARGVEPNAEHLEADRLHIQKVTEETNQYVKHHI